MKRLISLLLVFAMVFAFAGCETTETDTKDNETTESSTEATQEQTEPVEQTQPVSLGEALQNTAEAMKAGNLTVSIQGNVDLTQEQLPGLVSGMNVPLSGDIQLVIDQERENMSVYGVLNVSGVVMTVILHDGWLVTYDSTVEAYYKENVTEDLDAENQYEELEDILDQIPEEELEQLEEVVDLDKLLELAETLATEKFSDEQWLKDTFDYSSTTEGDVTVHTFELDLVVLLEAVISHFEGAFLDEDDFLDLMDELEDIDDFIPEFTLELSLIQTGDLVTGAGVYLELDDSNAVRPVKLDITLNFVEIGTTQIDTEMLESIIDELMEYDEFAEEYYGDEGTEQDAYQGGFMADFL